MKTKKGFTLIELLAVIMIIGILLIIAVPSVNKYLKRGTVEYYKDLESTVVLSGRDYLSDYRTLYPRVIGNVTVITLNELLVNHYVDPILDSNKKECDAKFIVKKVNKKDYEYYSCLVCENYQTEEEYCNQSEDSNQTIDSKYYSVKVDKEYYRVSQGESFDLPYAKAYYNNQLVSDKVVGSPRIIDTTKLGITEVTYSYQGAKATIKVEVIDSVSPSIPQVVLKKDSVNGSLYKGEWTNSDIYALFKSTDYTKDNLVGSDIAYYEVSSDNKNWNKIDGNSYLIAVEGSNGYYVRSVDKSNNISAVNYFSVKIDKTKPTCSLKVATGTKGSNNWYISDITLDFNTYSDDRSGINNKNIDITSITYDTKDKKITGTVVDNAGNSNTCSINVSVDKTNPTVTYNPAITNNSTELISSRNQIVTVTANDTYYNYMNIDVYKNKVNVSSETISSNSKSFELTDGYWTIYTKAYDLSGRKQNQNPDNGSGWYYQSYLIDTQAPTCGLEVKSGTQGTNGWYTSNVVVGFNADNTSGTGSNITYSYISNDGNVTTEGETTVTAIVTDQAGNIGTCSIPVSIEKTVTTPNITYNKGSNSCSWKNNYDLTLSSNAASEISYYEIDTNNDGIVDSTTGSNFIPWNGYNTCTERFRAVSNAGNRSDWTSTQHIHMDTEKPTHTDWWWGEVTKDVARLYIQATDNIGISKVQCPTSTQSGSYANWHWFEAVWDSNENAYRCDITPNTFGHYNQTYQVQLYMYDHAGNGGYYNQTSVNIPATCQYNIGKSWDFNYTGGVQSFTVPCSGTYKLEVWGAQGGSAPNALGGNGGYAYGNLELYSSEVIYITVGGAGTITNISGEYEQFSYTTGIGGYNGGGAGQASGHKDHCSYRWHTEQYGSGGGATHIATTNRGILKNYSDYRSEVLIVAGGGGGGNYSYQPEEYICCNNTPTCNLGNLIVSRNGGSGGSDNSYNINSFGLGDDTGGGGGYYGGIVTNYISGGGSSYIGGVTNGSMQNGVREGNGYARITLESLD